MIQYAVKGFSSLGLFDQLLSWRNSSRVSVARNSESLDDFRYEQIGHLISERSLAGANPAWKLVELATDTFANGAIC
jgi:hypothetical protein